MPNRLVAAVGIAGMAALASWILLRRQPEHRKLSPGPSIDVDDDTAAEIIRRFRPALDEVSKAERVRLGV